MAGFQPATSAILQRPTVRQSILLELHPNERLWAMSDILNPSETPDDEPEIQVSPADLGEFADTFIDSLFDDLDLASHTKDQFLKNLAALVHHARHLRPIDHAHLALLICKPFKRPRARPTNHALDEDVAHYLQFVWGPPTRAEKAKAIADLAKKHCTSKENVRRAWYKFVKASRKEQV